MAKAGRGVAFLPLSLAEADIQSGRLTRAGGTDLDVSVQIVIYRPRSRMAPHLEAFWQRALAGAAS